MINNGVATGSRVTIEFLATHLAWSDLETRLAACLFTESLAQTLQDIAWTFDVLWESMPTNIQV